MTSSGTIAYERLAQTAMRGVIREILKQTEQSGLPGEHHFYVQFETNAPGVNISKRLRQRYPDEMTIVLQHRFWDLAVHDDYFEVKLTFDSIPERLVVPFGAIKVFFDPSVRYALQFENLDMSEALERDRDENGSSDDTPLPGRRGLAAVEPNPIARIDRPSATSVPTLVALTTSSDSSAPHADNTEAELDDEAAQLEEFLARDTARNGANAAGDPTSAATDGLDGETAAIIEKSDADEDADENADEDDAEPGSGVVVSLDAFRKK